MLKVFHNINAHMLVILDETSLRFSCYPAATPPRRAALAVKQGLDPRPYTIQKLILDNKLTEIVNTQERLLDENGEQTPDAEPQLFS